MGGQTLLRTTPAQLPGFRALPGLEVAGGGVRLWGATMGAMGEYQGNRPARMMGSPRNPPPPSPPPSAEEADTGCAGWGGECEPKSEGCCQWRGGGGARHRNVTTSWSLRKPPLPLVGGIHPLRKAPEGELLRLLMLGQGGHQLAPRPSACHWPRMGTHGEGGVQGGVGWGKVRYRREATSGRPGVQTPSGAGYPREGKKATCGYYREFASAEDDECDGGSGGWGVRKRAHRRGRCWSRAPCVRGRTSGWRECPEETQGGRH